MNKFPPLFRNTKEFLAISFVLTIIISIRISFLYKEYKDIKHNNSYYIQAQVTQIYNKSKLLKLHSQTGFNFYLFNNNKDIKPLDLIEVKLSMRQETSFIDYLKGFFADGEVVKIIKHNQDPKRYFRDKIYSEHTEYKNLQNFYSAIYLADPLNKDLRNYISNLGVSHLVALSGFHLGIIWMMIFFLLKFPYKMIQQKFFPWRNINIDLGAISLIIIAIYVIFVGAPPSLIRSYFMITLAWLFLVIGVNLISFRLLAITLLLVILFQPNLIVSIALILSISGVFYIFLILKYLQNYPSWFISIIAIPVGLSILMFPIGHYFFSATSIWQLMSAPLSLIFIPFYPISAILHLFGYGDLFDKYLIELFKLPKNSIEIVIPNLTITIYLILSFFSIFSKKIFFLTGLVATLITVYSIYLTF